MEIKKLKKGLSEIKDPRRTRYGNYRHKLEDIIIIGLCTLVCGGEDFVDMEDFGKEREQWLRNFLELTNGIPDSDTFRRIFERIEPLELSNCLINWLECERTGQNVIAIDGKTIRGSGNQNQVMY